jgi:triphosphatase
MEIEAKYSIRGVVSPEALDQLDLAPYIQCPDQDLQQHDFVLDTLERAISRSRHGLRLRHANGQRILTFKGPNTVQGSVHRHEEIEMALPVEYSGGLPEVASSIFDWSQWPAEIQEPVASLIGYQADLKPIIEIQVHRQTWKIERDNVLIGELALDQGVIVANGRSEPVYELELELKGRGQEVDLETLDERLRHQLPLAMQSLSKRERGLALLDLPDNLRSSSD